MNQELLARADQYEQQMIGCVIGGAPMENLVGIVSEKHFTSDKTKTVWQAICTLHEKRKDITARSMRELLKGHQAFEDGAEMDFYIAGDQVTGIPRFAKETALGLINNHARLSLSHLATEALQSVELPEIEFPIDKIIHDFRDGLESLKTESGFKQSSNYELTNVMLNDIAHPPSITKTGIPSYDRILGGGFMAGETYTLGGASKAGKTMFAGTVSYNLSTQGVRHGYLCLEMGAKQIMQRQFCIYANMPLNVFFNEEARTSSRLADKIIEFQSQVMNGESQQFIDCPILRLSDAKALLYRLKMEGCEGVIVDYFSLISPDYGFKGNNNEHQDIMAQELTKIAKDIGIWVMFIAQLNNDGKTYGSSALLRASTHSAALERCETEEADMGFRWLRTMFSRFTPAEDIGSETEAGLRIHANGSHIEDITYG